MLIDSELLKKTGVFALVSGELAVTVGASFFFGHWVDQKLGTEVIFATLLPLAGLSFCVWRIIRQYKTETESENKDKKSKGKYENS